MHDTITGAPSLGDVTLLRQAAKAGRFRIRCEPRREGADPDAGMVWPMEIELPCINGLSCWFTVGNIYTPDRAAQGYTDGALNDDLARDFAVHIVGSLAAAREETDWQDIATAPKDGKPMLLACADWPAALLRGKPVPIKVGGWNHEAGDWQIFGASWSPTHWRHLPAPPTPAQTDTTPGGRTDV